MIIAVDIDGTLTEETEGWGDDIYKNRTPKLEVIKKINGLFDAGHKIILWTSRYSTDMKVTKEWLKKHGVKHTRLLMDKQKYDILLDDKSFSVVDDFYNALMEHGL